MEKEQPDKNNQLSFCCGAPIFREGFTGDALDVCSECRRVVEGNN